jgi:hypothetical protein
LARKIKAACAWLTASSTTGGAGTLDLGGSTAAAGGAGAVAAGAVPTPVAPAASRCGRANGDSARFFGF